MPAQLVKDLPFKNACGIVHVASPAGPFAFVACQEDGVFGVDLKDPQNPAPKGALVAPGMDARRLFADPQRLFVAAFGGGLHCYDIRNPNHPMPVSKIASAAIPYVEDVFAWGAYAFIVGSDGVNARFAVLDVRHLAQPRIVGGFTHVTRDPTSYVSVGFDGRLVYIGTNKGELHVLELSNLSRINRVGEYFCPRHEFRPPMLSGLVAFPGRLFMADWGQGLMALDTTNPQNPRLLGILQGPQASNTYRVAIVGTTAYVANGWGGLLAADVSSMSSTAGALAAGPGGGMRLLYEVAPPRASYVDLAVAGPYAIFANNGAPQGLTVMRVSP